MGYGTDTQTSTCVKLIDMASMRSPVPSQICRHRFPEDREHPVAVAENTTPMPGPTRSRRYKASSVDDVSSSPQSNNPPTRAPNRLTALHLTDQPSPPTSLYFYTPDQPSSSPCTSLPLPSPSSSPPSRPPPRCPPARPSRAEPPRSATRRTTVRRVTRGSPTPLPELGAASPSRPTRVSGPNS